MNDGGMKYDKGKPMAAILYQDFPDAMRALVGVSTFGANKYARHSWKTVPNALERYDDAMCRHVMDAFVEFADPESKIAHRAHIAWNALATLQMLIEEERNDGR